MELSAEDQKKLKRAIITGSVLASFYFFEHITADEWYQKNEEGKFVLKSKRILEEIFE
jgi:hypothetical protein